MDPRLLIFFIFFVLGGCSVFTPDAADEAPAVVVEPSPVERTLPTQPPSPLPAFCEVLLQSLSETRPMLENLDETLASHTERFEAALADLNQPAPEAPAPVCPPNVGGALGDKEIIGAMEWLYMDPPGRHFQARVDSGTETSSLSASDIVEFERDGEDWIRFSFAHDSAGEAVEFELPIKRTVLVRRVSLDEPVRRFVVELDVRLGDQLQTTEFMLTDRSNMTYPVSLGRAFLLDLYVIDVSRSYTHERYDAS